MKAQQLLEQMQEVTVLNLMDYVHELDEKFGMYFRQPDEGIYLVGQVNPILPAGCAYYAQSGFSQRRYLEKLDGVTEPIVDDEGNVLIHEYIMRAKERHLRAAPTVPSVAIKIASLVVQEYVESMLPHTEPYDFDSEIESYLIAAGIKLYRDGYMEATLRRLLNDVAYFVKADVWNIYFFKMLNTDLVIEKSVDYRIYQWTLDQENKDWTEEDEGM